MLRIEAHRRSTTLALLARHDGIVLDSPPLQAPWNLRSRALSLRTEPERHPYPGRHRWPRSCGCRRPRWRPALATPGHERLAAQLWLLVVLLVPTSWTPRIAISNTSGRIRRWFRQLRTHVV